MMVKKRWFLMVNLLSIVTNLTVNIQMRRLLNLFVGIFLASSLFACSNNNESSFYKDSDGLVQLEGIILNIPENSNLELALFALNNDNRPEKLIVSEHYKGIGNAFKFQIKFNLAKAEPFSALELRGRVMQSGKLVGYLIPWYKKRLTKQDLKGIILELASTDA